MATKLKDANVTSIKEGRRKGPQVPKDDPPQEPQESGAAGIGDNSLTPEQEAKALRMHHVVKLRAQQIKVDEAKAAHDVEVAIQTDNYRLAKADTRIPRKEFSALLAAMKKSITEISKEIAQRALLWSDWDLPVGHQPDLFDKMPQEIRDEAWAKSVGYKLGLRGDPCQMPEGMEVRHGPAFAAGWGVGQEELAWGLAAAGRIIDRREGAHGGPTREEIERQPEPADDPRETLPESDFEGEDGASDVL